MIKDDEQENEKNRDLVWLLKEDRTANQSSVNKKSPRATPDDRNWKVLERGKSEMNEPQVDLKEKKDTDSKLKRSTSFPVKAEKSGNSKGSGELRYPVNEREEDGFSPALYRSKSSLWSVSTDSSALTAQQRQDNRQSEVARSPNKLGSAAGSCSNLSPSNQDPGPSVDSPTDTLEQRSNSRFQINSPQPPKPQRGIHKTLSEEKVTIQPKKSKGVLTSVHEFKTKTNRDPEFINEHLKVNFQDIIAEPLGYHTPKFSWSLSKEIYEFTKGCCYTVVSLFCALPFAFFWGIWFSILACLNVWCLIPFKRSHLISISYWRVLWTVFVSCFCDPIYHSAGMVLNNISIRTEKHIV